MTLKQELLDRLQRAYDEELKFIATAGEEELTREGTADAWAVKDIFAHIAAWKVVIAERLDLADLDNPSPLYALPVDEQNFQFYDEYAGRPWPEVRALIDHGYQDLQTAMEALPEEYLSEGDRFPWQDGRPLWQRIGHFGFYHPLYHLAEVYRDRGDREQAQALIVEATDRMSSLSSEAPFIGSYAYNLACFFALTGENEQALNRLRQAFELRPDLIEWSKQDSDLDSLWDEPEYIALVSPDG